MAGESILIVDDNPQNLKLVRLLLNDEGYQVSTAIDAESALRVLETLKPALILMDIQLPGMDGLALTRLLKADETRRDIVIIALTAYAMKGDEERILDAGCDGYVTKPIDTDELAAQVRRTLTRQ